MFNFLTRLFISKENNNWLHLLNLLNIDKKYYNKDLLVHLENQVKKCAVQDAKFTCQCIVYSRCINQAYSKITNNAAIFVLPYITGLTYAKTFYSLWVNDKGGVILKPKDMLHIMNLLNKSGDKLILPNSIKKGFKTTLEKLDSYSLLKNRKSLINIINLTHPNPNLSLEYITVDNVDIYTLDIIVKNLEVSDSLLLSLKPTVNKTVVKKQKITLNTLKEVKKISL